ncbi:sensor histidine kinase [Actinocrinis puniceicyclus]|uniref:histidine kinase n=1 Tax=Actinocrinis puniceicyclus TaxID=977794 RepID=A0A8J7WRS3_9ACTN|nr:ATP-binding protein [Actinocrinis puniceicyclus]MBS2965495.1 sensor histidine kinase [Actinocrinis puniceicyclus]
MAVRSGQEPGRSAPGRTSGRRLDNIPFRRKLDALVALPAVAIVALLSHLVIVQVATARSWEKAASYMSTTEQVSVLIDDLGVEQDDALGVIGSIQLVDLASFNHAVQVTDNQRLTVLAAYGQNPPTAMRAALNEINALSLERDGVRDGSINGTILLQGYTGAMQDLKNAMGLAEQASNGNPAAVPEAELDILFQADLAASEREAALAEIADDPAEAPTQYPLAEEFDGVATESAQRLEQFVPPGDFALFDQTQKNPQQGVLAQFEAATASAFISGDKQATGELTGYARQVTDAALAQGQARTVMEATITKQVVQRAAHSASAAAWTAIGLVVLAIVLLVALIVFSVLIRHSIARPVLRLTRAATRIATVAEQDLQRVADDDPQHEGEAADLEHVSVSTRDEIGDLAESFNRLQETAVRVLERQVLVRRNTAEMFGNVGRRIYNLTGRQLALIDAMERSETDPVLLERLYRIDHLAVRLQRGADSLMLLSGEREAALDATPMRLTDVVRSAIGRIEGYQRVVLGADGDSMVTPAAIGDLTLMVAELVENAVAFSPTSSTVDVAVRSASRGAVVEIVDHGVGMTTQRLMHENELLVRRERLDLAPTKVLGLFVVGRLAQRTGATVTLAQTAGGGLTARITVPDELLLGSVELAQRAAGGSAAPAPRTVPTPPMPEPRREQTSEASPALSQRVNGREREGSMAQRPPTLPRRVRGARAAQPDSGGGRQGVSLAPAAQLDAEAARAAIEEFEAGVDQALRDSARGLTVPPPGEAGAYPPPPGDIDEEKGERL